MRRAPAIALGVVFVMALVPPMTANAVVYPWNDDFADAIEVTTFPQSFPDAQIAGAGWQTDEKWPCAAAGSVAKTIWYKFTYGSVNTGAIEVSAPGAKVTAFYLPSGSTIKDLSAGYCRGTATLLVPWFANRTDYIQIASDESSDTVTVTFKFVPRPANDDLLTAESVVLGTTTTGDTRLATIERLPSDLTKPQPYEVPGPSCVPAWGSYSWSRSVWYRFTPTSFGTVTIDPRDSSFSDVTLSAWSGDAYPANRVACARSRTLLSFAVSPWTDYFVQATDAAPSGQALSGGGTLKLKWIDSTPPPELTLPADITAEATSPAGATVSYVVSATDLVDGSITPGCFPLSGSPFPLGSSTVWCQATDSAGNQATGIFQVTVRDTTPPELTLPADITAEATSPSGAPVDYVASCRGR
jgi:hypothetical protein